MAEATSGYDPDAIPDCIFCLQYHPDKNLIMVQNETFFARYDNFPAAPGHVEIVPKRHVVSFFDLSPEEVRAAYELLLQAQERLAEQHRPAGYTIGVNEGTAAGRSVDHLHIHLIPRYKGDVEDPRGGIRQIVPGCEPDLWMRTT
jgi:diadenosine tetraphosphate (Ap4A) HIT family hydrolase